MNMLAKVPIALRALHGMHTWLTVLKRIVSHLVLQKDDPVLHTYTAGVGFSKAPKSRFRFIIIGWMVCFSEMKQLTKISGNLAMKFDTIHSRFVSGAS